jgi:hypothetical protein
MSLTHGRESGMGDPEVFPPFNNPDTPYPSCYSINAMFIVSCAPPPFVNLRTRLLLGGSVVTPRVTKTIIKSLKL